MKVHEFHRHTVNQNLLLLYKCFLIVYGRNIFFLCFNLRKNFCSWKLFCPLKWCQFTAVLILNEAVLCLPKCNGYRAWLMGRKDVSKILIVKFRLIKLQVAGSVLFGGFL